MPDNEELLKHKVQQINEEFPHITVSVVYFAGTDEVELYIFADKLEKIYIEEASEALRFLQGFKKGLELAR